MVQIKKIAIVGAGLAGSECAWVLAEKYKIHVTLFEMKLKNPTPAQVSPHLFSELVCSNSLKSKSRLNPAGVLKQEMIILGSLVLPSAYEHEVPAGETLAVDREKFSSQITEKLNAHPLVTVVHHMVESVAQIFSHDCYDAVVIATGPLTEQKLSEDLIQLTNSKDLYFYDAIAPIIDGETIDYHIAFKANRKTKTHNYEKKLREKKRMDPAASPMGSPRDDSGNSSMGSPRDDSGNSPMGSPRDDSGNSSAVSPLNNKEEPQAHVEEEGDYLNLPLNKEEYEAFVQKVVAGDKIPHHAFEEPRYFNGCQPIEVLAERGEKTLAFGPMKARGLDDPRTGRWPYAVVQLRKENLGDTAWSMVGFQSRLTWTAQKEIFKTIPGLKNAEFFRMGSMHRNTYMVSPNILSNDFSFKVNPRLYLAGQVMGVEGYLESAAMGLFIGHCIGQKLTKNKVLSLPPPNTSLGALAHYCLHAEAKYFSPMNIHWGLFSDLTTEEIEKFGQDKNINPKQKKLEKSVKRELMACRSEFLFEKWLEENELQ